jgi:hypothetical protein
VTDVKEIPKLSEVSSLLLSQINEEIVEIEIGDRDIE